MIKVCILDYGSGNVKSVFNVINHLGYDVEIDVWLVDNEFFLGHDEPQYKVHGTFLMTKGLWCHAKNIEAFYLMSLDNRIHCFFHDQDDVALDKSFISSKQNKLMDNRLFINLINLEGYTHLLLFKLVLILIDVFKNQKNEKS